MYIFRLMLVSVFAVSGLSYGSAVSSFDKIKAATKLIGAGVVVGGATIGVDKLSPEITKVSIGATLLVSTLIASRVFCGCDINIKNKAIALPMAGQSFPEVNWFNTIVLGFGLATYGLYKNSDQLALALNSIVSSATAP